MVAVHACFSFVLEKLCQMSIFLEYKLHHFLEA